MSDIAEFLLARIAEDEAGAREAATREGAEAWRWMDDGDDTPITEAQYADVIAGSLRSEVEFSTTSGVGDLPVFLTSPGGSPEILWTAAQHIARHDPARVLAECEAKRRIVSRCDMLIRGPELGAFSEAEAAHGRDILRALALPYADHEAYRAEWRP